MQKGRVYCLLGALIFGAMMPTAPAMAYGEAGRWSSGWGQGTTEYVAVVDEQNQLYIACNDIRKVSMTAMVSGKGYGDAGSPGFAIIVDGQRFDEPYETESRVGENNFFSLWDKMRSAKTIAIATADGQELALPTLEAATVLPATQSTDFGCLAWDKDTTESPVPAPASVPAPEPAPTQLSAAISPATFSVRWYFQEWAPRQYFKKLEIVSHSNNITLRNAILNRGNCPLLPAHELPMPLGFGQAHTLPFSKRCNLLEVQLFTDQGTVTYQFDPQS
ncbi:hypothetical protein ACW5WQ_08245 [Aeromonas rivuli]|uniref:hypothetical protein n=1 Tax=Aeromonas rivuli TaxID=648794 RepID=UPI000AA69499|nr:hypothetical protein [Aeromonas rivuli]